MQQTASFLDSKNFDQEITDSPYKNNNPRSETAATNTTSRIRRKKDLPLQSKVLKNIF
jgi:hypothetical protein